MFFNAKKKTNTPAPTEKTLCCDSCVMHRQFHAKKQYYNTTWHGVYMHKHMCMYQHNINVNPDPVPIEFSGNTSAGRAEHQIRFSH